MSTYSIDEMQSIAEKVAGSGMFGIRNTQQAFTLMMLCQSEGLHPMMAMRRYHLIEVAGKVVTTMRADAMQGEFEAARGHAIIWHMRDESEASATFIRDYRSLAKPEQAAALKRSKERYKLQRKAMDSLLEAKESDRLIELGEPDEMTIIRRLVDEQRNHVCDTWKWNDDRDHGKGGAWKMKATWQSSKRLMLHARCLTEGVRAIDPGLIAGIVNDDEAEDIRSRIEIETGEAEENHEASKRSRESDAEQRVRQAVENRTETVVDAEIVNEGETDPPASSPSEDKQTRPGASLNDPAANWGDVVCHIGEVGKSAFWIDDGDGLRRRTVKELHQNVLIWLRDKWMPTLNLSFLSEIDSELRNAVIIALKQSESEKPAEPVKEKINWREVTVPFKCSIQRRKLGELGEDTNVYLRKIKSQRLDVHKDASEEDELFRAAVMTACEETGALLNADELRAAIKERFTDLALAADTIDGYLFQLGVMPEPGDTIETISEHLLRYIYGNWSMVETELKKLAAGPKARRKVKK